MQAVIPKVACIYYKKFLITYYKQVYCKQEYFLQYWQINSFSPSIFGSVKYCFLFAMLHLMWRKFKLFKHFSTKKRFDGPINFWGHLTHQMLQRHKYLPRLYEGELVMLIKQKAKNRATCKPVLVFLWFFPDLSCLVLQGGLYSHFSTLTSIFIYTVNYAVYLPSWLLSMFVVVRLLFENIRPSLSVVSSPSSLSIPGKSYILMN